MRGEDGRIDPSIRFRALAAHVWFCETGRPSSKRFNSPFLGAHEGVGYYLLYNGILEDKSTGGGNVLTHAVLKSLPRFAGPRVVYGTACPITEPTLRALGVEFKHIPYQIRGA